MNCFFLYYRILGFKSRAFFSHGITTFSCVASGKSIYTLLVDRGITLSLGTVLPFVLALLQSPFLLLRLFEDLKVFHIWYREKIQEDYAYHICGIFSEVLLWLHYHLLLFQDVKVLHCLHPRLPSERIFLAFLSH